MNLKTAMFGRYSQAALGILIVSGFLIWLSMVMMTMPRSFSFQAVDKTQWLGLGFSVGISVLWWGRLAMTYHEGIEVGADNP